MIDGGRTYRRVGPDCCEPVLRRLAADPSSSVRPPTLVADSAEFTIIDPAHMDKSRNHVSRLRLLSGLAGSGKMAGLNSSEPMQHRIAETNYQIPVMFPDGDSSRLATTYIRDEVFVFKNPFRNSGIMLVKPLATSVLVPVVLRKLILTSTVLRKLVLTSTREANSWVAEIFWLVRPTLRRTKNIRTEPLVDSIASVLARVSVFQRIVDWQLDR